MIKHHTSSTVTRTIRTTEPAERAEAEHVRALNAVEALLVFWAWGAGVLLSWPEPPLAALIAPPLLVAVIAFRGALTMAVRVRRVRIADAVSLAACVGLLGWIGAGCVDAFIAWGLTQDPPFRTAGGW